MYSYIQSSIFPMLYPQEILEITKVKEFKTLNLSTYLKIDILY